MADDPPPRSTPGGAASGSATGPENRRSGAAPPAERSLRRASLSADHDAGQRRLEGWMLRQQLKEALTLPLVGIVLLALLGGSRFTETREAEAVAIALGLPVVAMVAATAPLWESDSAASRGARAAAAATALLAELAVAPAVLRGTGYVPGWAQLPGWSLVAGLITLGVVSVPLEALLVRRGMNSRFAAWTGLVVALALYLPPNHATTDALGGILAAGIFALAVGGLSGLLLGVAGRRVVGSRV